MLIVMRDLHNIAGDKQPVLLTGATGYIGGRLLRRLEEEGIRVRCLVRNPAVLAGRVAPETEVVQGDVRDAASVERAMEGVRAAYYLVHSMASAGSFEEQDRQAARNFARAAERCGVERIIYLGGLAHGDERELSSHLRSRLEVGRIFRDGAVPSIELRASIVIGSGSLSFEIVRNLTERLPVMICPRWVSMPAQPIAIGDVLEYLRRSLEIPLEGHRVFEIGGADVVSYGDLMREYARQRNLKRLMIPVPVLTPWLSSLWLGLVTPVYARVGRKLIESVRHATVVRDHSALDVFGIRPAGVREAIAAALRNEDRELAETRWSDALSSSGVRRDWGGVRFGSRLVDSRSVEVPVPCEQAFAPIRRIGGETGWYSPAWLWRLRGVLDLLSGGVGMRRGRRDPEYPHVGDALDFWRVERYEENRLLRLYAEMKVPGRAWLEFEVSPVQGGSRITQTALFDPLGLTGLVYWYALWPVHQLVFGRMLRGIARTAAGESASPAVPQRERGNA
ncbi:MAG: SDR family oxidoreductase [Armatimonadota bacterium]